MRLNLAPDGQPRPPQDENTACTVTTLKGSIDRKMGLELGIASPSPNILQSDLLNLQTKGTAPWA